MKVGDLLQYYGAHGAEDAIGLALELVEVEYADGTCDKKMKTIWFDDMQTTEEPLPGDPSYNDTSVTVISPGSSVG